MSNKTPLHNDPLVAAAAQKIIDVAFNKASIDEEVKEQNAILGRYVKVAKNEGVTDNEIAAWKKIGLDEYQSEKILAAEKAEAEAAEQKKGD